MFNNSASAVWFTHVALHARYNYKDYVFTFIMRLIAASEDLL
jgi:hypothetical protein